MIVVPPCRGEFGLKIRYHVPQVHALLEEKRETGDVVVIHEHGEEALFPGLVGRFFPVHPVDPIDDDLRRGMWPKGDRKEAERIARMFGPDARLWKSAKGKPERRFIPEPWIEPLHLPELPVVICPRWRRYGSAKNWDGWRELARALGPIAVAAGNAEASLAVGDAVAGCTWTEPRPLDASIRAMRNAEVVIATDAGLAHLAVLCGVPLLLIVTYRGLVAPGPVLDPDGKELEPEYWPVRLEEYYERANHAGTEIRLVDAWEEPGRVLDLVKIGGRR